MKVFSASRGGEYGDCGVGAELGYVLVLWKQQETAENYGHTKEKKEKRRPRTGEANKLETRLFVTVLVLTTILRNHGYFYGYFSCDYGRHITEHEFLGSWNGVFEND